MEFANRRTILIILSLVAITLLFTKLGQGGLPSYDDAYYAQKAKEMIQKGSVLTVYYNGAPSFDNPPGLFWLIAGSYKIFGIHDFGAVFPSAVAGLLGILGTFFLFELLFSSRIGFLAAAVLTLTSVYLKYSRHSHMDAEVTACGVWAFYCFFRAMRGSSLWYIVAGLLGSYVFFMKSAFGVIPPFILFTYLLTTRQFAPFKKPAFWLGAVLLVVPYGVWVLHQRATFGDGFINEHFHALIVHMAVTGSSDDHFYDYGIVLLKYFPIWLPFMFWGLWRAIKARGEQARSFWFPAVFFLSYLVILSAQATTKTWYFLPALPACAGLAALGLDQALKRYDLNKLVRAYSVLGIFLFLIFHMTSASMAKEREREIRLLAPYVRAVGDSGFQLLGYEIDFFGINNALLFYSDKAATAVKSDQLNAKLAEPGKIAVLVPIEKWSKVEAQHPELKVLKNSGAMILAVNAPVATETVFGELN